MSPSSGFRALMRGAVGAWGVGFIGLNRAAASLAAILDGDGARWSAASLGTPSVLELLDLLMAGLLTLCEAELPPVQSRCRLSPAVLLGRPVPTFAAASKAPFFPPTYVFACGFGLTGGLLKASDAPQRAASRTLCCVSPVDRCVAWLRLCAELIWHPSD